MTVQEQIEQYLAEQSPSKRDELQELDRRIRGMAPDSKSWFLDGRNDEGKVVTNPNIGYGAQTMKYADGETREFYQVGLSANTTGISVYLMGIEDKTYLPETYGKRLGKAKVTGYCVKFRSIKDVDIEVLEQMIADCMGRA